MKKKSALKPLKNNPFPLKGMGSIAVSTAKIVDNFLHNEISEIPACIKDGGECGQIIRSIDWSKTTLGPVKSWSNSLKNCLRIMLTSPQPIWIGWGEDLINLYNDAYKTILGNQHPHAIGKPVSMVYQEVWENIRPRIQSVINENKVVYVQSELFILNRYGDKEETYYTFTFRPLSDDNGKIAGFFCSTVDETKRIIEERQLRTLKDLGKSLINVKTETDVFQETIQVLKENSNDFPFACFYKIDEKDTVELKFTTNAIIKKISPDSSFFKQALKKDDITLAEIPPDWPKIPACSPHINLSKILIIPIAQSAKRKPYALLIIGLNRYMTFNEKYQNFYKTVANQIAASIENVTARKKIEDSENKLRIAVELAQMGTWDYDPNTDCIECSDRTREIFGLEKGCTINFKQLIDIIVEEDREKLIHAVQLAIHPESGGNYDIEYSIINCMDKKIRTVRAKGKALFNSKNEYYLFTGTIIDITEQKKMINAIKESEERFRIMANTAPVMIWMSGEDKYGDFFNTSWLKFTGRTLEQEIKNGWLKDVHPDDVLRCVNTYKEAFSFQEPFNIEYRLKRHDGQYRWVSDHAAPRYDSNGTFIGYVGACIDIDDQKLFSEKLQQSELLFKTIANSCPIGLWMTDPNGMNTFVNNTLIECSGMSAEELSGFGWVACIADEYKSLITDPDKILKYIIKRERYSMEYQAVRHNGEKHWVFSEGIPFYNINGEFGGYSGYIVDITDKKLIQEELEKKVAERTAQLKRSEEQHYKMINEVSDYSIILLDKDGNIQNWNKGAEKIKGYKDHEIIGKNFKTFYPLDVQEQKVPEKLIDEAIKNGRATIEGWKVKKDQILFWANTVITALHDEENNIIGFSSVTRDLTEKRIAEQKLEAHAMELSLKNNELKQQKEFVDAIIDSSVDIVCVLNKELRYLSFNKVAESIYGKQKDQVIGKEVTEVFPHMEHTDSYASLLKVLENGEPHDDTYKSEINGRYYHTFFIPLKNNGEIYAILIISHDNTEIIEASKKLEEAYTILKQKSNDLEIANKELEKSNNELEQFAYVASHDLQEPLRKIQFFIERLEKALQNIDPSAKFLLDKIKNSANRMNTLIKDLLDFSKLSQGNTSFVKTNLNFILESVKTDFELLIQQKKATIKIDKLPIIECIPLQMQQLFSNVINNALKFSRSDIAPIINISCQKLPAAEVSGNFPHLNRTTDYYRITVKDNGIGFDQQYAEKIFVIFQRLNDLYTYGGTGIGLAICKKIVINHHGEIYAAGNESEGASFYIILPEKHI